MSPPNITQSIFPSVFIFMPFRITCFAVKLIRKSVYHMGRDNAFLTRSGRGKLCVFLARSGPRIALQSCGIYSKHTQPSLQGVLRTLRKIKPRIAMQSCGIYSKSITTSQQGVLRTLRKIKPRIALQSCGIYSKHTQPSLQGVLRTLRNKFFCLAGPGKTRLFSCCKQCL